MYIVVNRFQVALGHEADFETLWSNGEIYLDSVPGFLQFHFLKGSVTDTHTLYAAHTIWENRQFFEDWLGSEAFKKTHARANVPKGTYINPPALESFDVILSEPSAG